MIAALFLGALVSQTPAMDGSISGAVLDAASGKPAANVRVILARTDIVPASSIKNPLSETQSTTDVFLPGEWWSQIADKNAVDALTAAGFSGADIRQILISPDGALAIALYDPVTTDNQGTFVFNRVQPGNYRLVTVANGYAQQEYRRRAGDSIALAAGQSIDLQLPILPTGAVSGRIQDQSEHPIPDITVQLIRFAYDATGRNSVRVAAFAHTNDRGEYRLFFVPPGRYYLQANSSYGSTNPSSSDLAARAVDHTVPDRFVNTFYPGGHDVDSASVIEVGPGAEVDGLDFSMSRFPVFRIQGKILDTETQRPPDRVEIYLYSGTTPLSTTGTVEVIAIDNSTDGSFELRDVPAGIYALEFVGDSAMGEAGIVITTSDRDMGELNIGSGKPVLGRVRMDKDSPFPASLDFNKLSVELSFATIDFEPYGVYSRTYPLAADGTLRIRSVTPGNYRVSLTKLPAGLYIKEIRFGETDVLRDALRVQGSAIDTLEIVLASDPGRIQGQASDGKGRPASGSQIVLVPDQRNRKNLFRSVSADETGRFTFTSIPPGDYKLFAWESLEPYGFFDPEVLRAAEPRGTPIHVTASSTQTVNINPIEAEVGSAGAMQTAREAADRFIREDEKRSDYVPTFERTEDRGDTVWEIGDREQFRGGRSFAN